MTEKGEAKRDGASLQRNSGRGILEKGDAQLGPFLIDYKEYDESFSISRKVWAKARLDAWRMKLEPAIKVALGGGKEKVRVWIISEGMFKDMYEAWLEKYDR